MPSGIKESELVAEMVSLTPLSAQRIIEDLLEQEILVMQVTQQSPSGPPAIFGKPKEPPVSYFTIAQWSPFQAENA